MVSRSSTVYLLPILFAVFSYSIWDSSEPDNNDDEMAGTTAEPENIYGFTATDIDGNDVAMEQYRGKVVLVVNIASR